jgi:hypothetical protein
MKLRERRDTSAEIWWGSLQEMVNLEYLSIDGRMILKRILK